MDKRIFIQSSEMTLDRMLAIAGIRYESDLFQTIRFFLFFIGKERRKVVLNIR